MDDIEKLEAENSDLRTTVDELKSNKYRLEGELRKATETNERLLRILENLSMDMRKRRVNDAVYQSKISKQHQKLYIPH